MLKDLCKSFILISSAHVSYLLLDIAIAVFADDHSRYTWGYTVKNKSEVIGVFKKFYADTAIIHSKYPLCCIHCDSAGENMSAALKSWLTDKGIRSESLTPFEPWQNG